MEASNLLQKGREFPGSARKTRILRLILAVSASALLLAAITCGGTADEFEGEYARLICS